MPLIDSSTGRLGFGQAQGYADCGAIPNAVILPSSTPIQLAAPTYQPLLFDLEAGAFLFQHHILQLVDIIALANLTVQAFALHKGDLQLQHGPALGQRLEPKLRGTVETQAGGSGMKQALLLTSGPAPISALSRHPTKGRKKGTPKQRSFWGDPR